MDEQVKNFINDPITSDNPVDFKEYWRIVERFKWRILFFSSAITVLAVVFSLSLTPQYQSTVTLMIETERANTVSIDEIYGMNSNRRDYYMTQFEILKSRYLIEKVIDRLDLLNKPGFNQLQAQALQELNSTDIDNGWNELVSGADATMYNHNLYLQYGIDDASVTVSNNIITRGSSHGIHGRPGGIYEDNLLVENSVSLGIGYRGQPLPTGTTSIVRKNVILSGKLMDPHGTHNADTPAIWGLIVDQDALNNDASLVVEDNIIAHRKHSGSNESLMLISGTVATGNIVYKWDDRDMYDPAWSNPEINIDDYMNSIGSTPTLEAFLSQSKSRKLNEWDPVFAAETVNDFIRSGFNLN